MPLVEVLGCFIRAIGQESDTAATGGLCRIDRGLQQQRPGTTTSPTRMNDHIFKYGDASAKRRADGEK